MKDTPQPVINHGMAVMIAQTAIGMVSTEVIFFFEYYVLVLDQRRNHFDIFPNLFADI